HRVELDGIAGFGGDEAIGAPFDRHRGVAVADGEAGEFAGAGAQRRHHRFAPAVRRDGGGAGFHHRRRGDDADDCEPGKNEELPRVHDWRPSLTGTGRRGRRIANINAMIATTSGTTPTLRAVTQLLRSSTLRRKANWTSRNSERMESNWARNPSIACICSGVRTSLLPSGARGIWASFCSVSLSSWVSCCSLARKRWSASASIR